MRAHNDVKSEPIEIDLWLEQLIVYGLEVELDKRGFYSII